MLVDLGWTRPVVYGGFSFGPVSLPNVLCSPHIGYVAQNSYALYFEAAFENAVNFLEGRPTNIANRELLPWCRRRRVVASAKGATRSL